MSWVCFRALRHDQRVNRPLLALLIQKSQRTGLVCRQENFWNFGPAESEVLQSYDMQDCLWAWQIKNIKDINTTPSFSQQELQGRPRTELAILGLFG